MEILQNSNIAIYPLFINSLPVFAQVGEIRYYAYLRKRKAIASYKDKSFKSRAATIDEMSVYEVLFKKDKSIKILKDTLSAENDNIFAILPLKQLLKHKVSELVDYPFDMDAAFGKEGLNDEVVLNDSNNIEFKTTSGSTVQLDVYKVTEDVVKNLVLDGRDKSAFNKEQTMEFYNDAVSLYRKCLESGAFPIDITNLDGNPQCLPEALVIRDTELHAINLITPLFNNVMSETFRLSALQNKTVFAYQYYMGYASIMQQEFRNNVGNSKSMVGKVPAPSAYGEGFKLLHTVNKEQCRGLFIFDKKEEDNNSLLDNLFPRVSVSGNLCVGETGSTVETIYENVILKEDLKHGLDSSVAYKLYSDTASLLHVILSLGLVYNANKKISEDWLDNFKQFESNGSASTSNILNFLQLLDLYLRVSAGNRQFRITGLTFLNFILISTIFRKDFKSSNLENCNLAFRNYSVYTSVMDKEYIGVASEFKKPTNHSDDTIFARLGVLNVTAYLLLEDYKLLEVYTGTGICFFSKLYNKLYVDRDKFDEWFCNFDNYHSFMGSLDRRHDFAVLTLRKLIFRANKCLSPEHNGSGYDTGKSYTFCLNYSTVLDLYKAYMTWRDGVKDSIDAKGNYAKFIYSGLNYESWCTWLKDKLTELKIVER